MPKTGWESLWHKHPAVRSGDQLTLGERAADRMRNVMGSWPFVFGFFAVMIQLVVAYWVKVGRLEAKGRPRK